MLGDITFTSKVRKRMVKVKGKTYTQYWIYMPKWLGDRLQGKKIELKLLDVKED